MIPRAKKRLGQHFLHDTRVLDRIVAALAPTAADTVIEVGPGRGALTDRLAAAAGRVVAIELDRDLVPLLRARYAARPSVTVVEGDVLDQALGVLAGGPYLLAGNVPYYVTTPILFHALRSPRPARAVYLVQKEVADRIVAPPGDAAYGALSVNVRALATAERLFTVGAGAFQPPPSVESAVLRIVPRPDPLVSPAEEHGFQRFVIGLFGQRRKQLVRALRESAGLSATQAAAVVADAGVAPDVRAETLAPDVLVRLYRALPAR